MSIRTAIGMRLSECDSVLMIESAISVCRTRKIPRFKERISEIGRRGIGWRCHPLHFPERIPGLSSVMTKLNRCLLRRDVDRLIHPGMMRIACYDSPWQHHLAGKLGEQVSVYVAIDDRTLTLWGDPIPGELEAEKRLLAKVDSLICVSDFLADVLKRRIPPGRNIPIHVLSNGYDERLFDTAAQWKEPAILDGISRPRILVAGHVSERIDWDGVVQAAQLRPEWTWLFVGNADRGFPERIQSLNRQGSARFVWRPPVGIREMPALISHCDASAVPYRLNRFTLASSPLKGIECLAMGTPLLSTRVPSLLQYDSAIHWLEQGDGESYARALDRVKAERQNRVASSVRHKAVSGDSHEEHVRRFRQILLNEVLETGLQAAG